MKQSYSFSPELQKVLKGIDASRSALVIADCEQADFPLVYCNQAFMELTGYEESEIIGRNCRFLQRGDTDQPGLEELREALHNKQEASVTVKNYRKDGSMFWNDLLIMPVLTNGRLSHFIGSQMEVDAPHDTQL